MDFVAGLDPTRDPFGAFQHFIEARGGKGFLYGFGTSRKEFRENAPQAVPFLHHTYSREWETIGSSQLLEDDATVDLLLAGMVIPLEWNPSDTALFRSQMTPAQRALWDAEQDIGLINGVTIPLSVGTGFSGLGFHHDSTGDNHNFRKDWYRYGKEIIKAAHALDDLIRIQNPNSIIKLTPREIDCLSWLSMGYRPAEISFRMKISEKTFEKYVQGAKFKLRARTRDHAVVRAISLKIIEP